MKVWNVLPLPIFNLLTIAFNVISCLSEISLTVFLMVLQNLSGDFFSSSTPKLQTTSDPITSACFLTFSNGDPEKLFCVAWSMLFKPWFPFICPHCLWISRNKLFEFLPTTAFVSETVFMPRYVGLSELILTPSGLKEAQNQATKADKSKRKFSQSLPWWIKKWRPISRLLTFYRSHVMEIVL